MRLSNIFEIPDKNSLLLGLREIIFMYFQHSEISCFYLSSSPHVSSREQSSGSSGIEAMWFGACISY